MQLSIKWSHESGSHCEAIFVKTIVGVRVVVDVYRAEETVPCRTETGALGPMLKTLLDPAGRYRMAPMMSKTVEQAIEDLFDASAPEHVAETVTDLSPRQGQELGYTLHPIFREALRPLFGRHG